MVKGNLLAKGELLAVALAVFFHQYLNMMFDAPACLYHYYLCMKNSARETASSSPFTSRLPFAMQLKPRNQGISS